ncbi:MAG: pentapeptide repeat-containing protein [Acidimicrobiales bacterium]
MASEEYSVERAREGACRGADLENADLAERDLRGADFTNAVLRSANLSDARLGVPPNIGWALLLGASIVAVVGGFVIGLVVEQLREQLFEDEWDRVAEGGSVAIVLALLVGVIYWRGFDLAFRVVVLAYVVVVVVNVGANAIWDEVEYGRIVEASALVAFLVLAVLAGILGRVVGGVFGAWSIAVVGVLGGLATGRAQGGFAGIVVGILLVAVSKRAVRGDTRDRSIRRMANRIVRHWGTRFVRADLTGADFTGTDTGGCDVRGAILVDVKWDPELPLPVDLPDESARR